MSDAYSGRRICHEQPNCIVPPRRYLRRGHDLWQELSWNGNEIDDWRSLINANPSRTESEPVRVEFQCRELDVQVINDSGPSQSIDVDLDGALGNRGGQRDDQHDDKHCDEENSSPPRVEIHWHYRAWEPTLLFNNQQTIAFQSSWLGVGLWARKRVTNRFS